MKTNNTTKNFGKIANYNIIHNWNTRGEDTENGAEETFVVTMTENFSI